MVPVLPAICRLGLRNHLLCRSDFEIADDDSFLSNVQGLANQSSITPLPIVNRGFTMKDIQDRLAYADQALRDPKRKLSPIGIRALRLYDEACFRLLDLEEGEIYEDGEQGLDATKHEWKSKIRTYDQDMQYTACLVMTRSEDAQELQEQLVMLRKT